MKTNIQQNLIKKPINGSEQFFISDAVVFCNKCCAHAKYEMKDKYDGFSCHCFEYIRGENVGFSYDDNHMNGNTDSMFKVSPSRISPKDTVNIYDVNEQFVRTEDVSFDEFIEVLNEEEVKWFEKNSEKIRDIYLAREDEEKKDSQVNGWEKDGQKLFGDAMRKYRPEHRYLFIGDIEMDASVVRAAELMKEAT